jgi:hypothetical protein
VNEPQRLLAVFGAGLVARDVFRFVQGHILAWYWDREFRKSQARMLGCKHERVTRVDVGVMADKCLDCWALRFADGPVRDWTPNSAKPPAR